MPRYIVKLSRSAYETASIEVDAHTEDNAVQIALKEMERPQSEPADKRVLSKTTALHCDDESVWDEDWVDEA